MKKDHKKTSKAKFGAIVSDKVKSYANDPFVIKKAKESRLFLEKHGFPQDLLAKKGL